MNTFYEHHENSIRFGYRCFDRILLNGLIQPFQQPERVVGFFQHVPPAVPGQQGGPPRHCHPVPALGHGARPAVGCPDCRRAGRTSR